VPKKWGKTERDKIDNLFIPKLSTAFGGKKKIRLRIIFLH
jgi:hypothetical protein